MKAQIEIDLENEAFCGPKCGQEVARILRELANYLADDPRFVFNGAKVLRDVNGNKVGFYRAQEYQGR